MNKERLTELLEISFNELASNQNLKSELTEYYKFIYDVKSCTSCKNKFKSYYDKLMIDGVERLTPKPSLFKLRGDLMTNTITLENGLSISQEQAENEVCISFLKSNPKRISMFEEYPSNWQELINNNENEIANE